MKYDLIVVGAGVAGCHLAARVAQAGLKVALADARPEAKIGNPWEVTVKAGIFDDLGIKRPGDGLQEESPTETIFYAKNPRVQVKINRANLNLATYQHQNLNRYFLDRAIRSGADYLPRHLVEGPVIDQEAFTGVTGTRPFLFFKRAFRLQAPLVADCSGVPAVLRGKAPESFGIPRDVPDQDFASAWEEIWETDGNEFLLDGVSLAINPGTCYTRLGKYQAFASLHRRKNGWLQMVFGASRTGGNQAHNICQQYKALNPHLKKRISGGGGILPVRRSLDNLVGDGFLLVGDSACQVIPTMGSGIEASLTAADRASSAVIAGHNQGDFSRRGLWRYNFRYQIGLGAVLAGYDILRQFLQRLTLEEVNQILESGMVDAEHFAASFSTAHISSTLSDLADKVLRVLSRPRILPLILRFRQALTDSRKAEEVYRNYPEHDGEEEFAQWKKKAGEIFSK